MEWYSEKTMPLEFVARQRALELAMDLAAAQSEENYDVDADTVVGWAEKFLAFLSPEPVMKEKPDAQD